MKVYLDGLGFMIKDLGKDDMQSLLKMITGASLNERRVFYSLKTQIEDLKKNDLL